MLVDFLSNGLDIQRILQKDMQTYRKLITCHIVRNKLHYSLGKNTNVIHLIDVEPDVDDEEEPGNDFH